MVARILTAALLGVDACPVDVEIDLGPGLQAFFIAGLPDGAVREARVRVKAAMENSGFAWPMRRVSLNLAPADVRKDGSAYDLPIALAVLSAAGHLDERGRARLARYLVYGELALDGALRPVRGALSLAMCAREQGLDGVIVPADNAAEAGLVRGLEVVACASLDDAVRFARTGADDLVRPSADPDAVLPTAVEGPDMADVSGQVLAKRALEVAAAGGHNVLMVGPPGSGKTMLAKRVSGILPAMSFDEALETTRVWSVAGLTDRTGLVPRRPFRAPHHTISNVGLVGGGSGMPRPGELSLAHHGVLFLDELPEFSRAALEVMRQPLEDGHVTITRSLITVRYPAGLMLVASMNPCPCGYLTHPSRPCLCTQQQVAAYRGRVSGPLLDRIDLHVDVAAVDYTALRAAGRAEPTADIRARVEAARAVQRRRFADAPIHCNAEMTPKLLRAHCQVDAAGHALLERVIDRLGMSARAWDRILKVARTIADLAGEDAITGEHVAEAVQYRQLDRADGC